MRDEFCYQAPIWCLRQNCGLPLFEPLSKGGIKEKNAKLKTVAESAQWREYLK